MLSTWAGNSPPSCAGCRPQLSATYSDERRAVAHELIDFDREWAEMLSAPLKSRTPTARASIPRMCRIISPAGPLHCGNRDLLPPSIICRRSNLSAPGHGPADREAIPFGSGHPSCRRQACSNRPRGEADGRWRLFAFAATRTRQPRPRAFTPSATSLPTLPVADPPLHPAGCRHRCRNRPPGRLPAGPSRSEPGSTCPPCSCLARVATDCRLRKDVLPRPQAARTSSTFGASTAIKAASSSSVPTSMSLTSSRSTPTMHSPHLRPIHAPRSD